MGNDIYFKPGPLLTFQSVVDVRIRLSKVLQQSQEPAFCLDLSEVTRCDSAGLALLIEARKLAHTHNKSFGVIGISPETQSLAEFCGVKRILEAPGVLSTQTNRTVTVRERNS